ncbi:MULTISPECIES: hypothetical protein [unclassified Vagococcus]|uniref:hypothetical protein n=1 Tax=unclassified Vagococcus TaxID=2648499 RepID=UPI001F511655|nr:MULTISPECIES: hypothetical protein [unclassified Vagococcus]MCI0130552.1 hypothetical protein [Vagococcus sp. CY53-2]UNM89981.1 hypothetical protein MN187_02495 [Vagococcus sp. CY52-2]
MKKKLSILFLISAVLCVGLMIVKLSHSDNFASEKIIREVIEPEKKVMTIPKEASINYSKKRQVMSIKEM